MHMPCWLEPVEVKPGQTIEVTIGGKGRPVIGRVVLDGVPEAAGRLDAERTGDDQHAEHGSAERRDFVRRFGSKIDKDGRFRIEDVTPGHYELDVDVNPAADPPFCGPGTRIGRVKVPVTVPEIPGGRTNEPLDLGTITAKLFETLKAGDLAPDFTVQRIGAAGRRATQAERSSRASWSCSTSGQRWCGPCLAEMPALKDIQADLRHRPAIQAHQPVVRPDRRAGRAVRSSRKD